MESTLAKTTLSPPPSDSFPARSSDAADDDDSPLSHYSSCGGGGGDSEFDRYCSANSALGTPSICSSSFGPLIDSSNSIENFKLDVRDFEDPKGTPNDMSSDHESMFGCVSDDDDEKRNNNLYAPRIVWNGRTDGKGDENENPLGMNSSVAFGSEDWDDFELSFNHFQLDHDQQEDSFQAQVPPLVFEDRTNELTNDNEDGDDVIDVSITCNPIQVGNDVMENSRSDSDSDVCEMRYNPLDEKDPMLNCMNIDITDRKDLEHREAGNLEVEVADRLSDKASQQSTGFLEAGNGFVEDSKQSSTLAIGENSLSDISKDRNPVFEDVLDDDRKPVKVENLELREFYDEIVNEMEEILLDSGESPGSRLPQANHLFHSQPSLPARDGGSTASTSGTDIAFPLNTQPLRIDRIEVVGAKQKKGQVSFSERLVGVKEYTVYVIRVWSGKNQWEVERRYRDFHTLYRRLKSVFSDQGWTLPSPWFSVEKESRKIFGNVSPDVVSERSVLIQECLCSILHSGFFSTPPSALTWFLCPQDSLPSSPALQAAVHGSIFSNIGADMEKISNLGKTISLIVEIRPYKSMKQMLESQHYTCAGCHKHFDDGMTLMRDFVQTLGWGKPRICEYTGQLFCSSCHTNETAVLPARVLQFWDFNRYPVSQLAKSYLDSIHEQPMLCVSAVNPYLFSKVPALHQVMNVRKKIGTMLPYIRCPFRRTINRGIGSRRYLLESNDFFALKDLVDLSKGPFSALPVMVETVSWKILEHITEQCLLCCDVGVPCSARQACDDPSSLIFPFQEGEIERCKSCESVFHKPCFRKLANCSCGADLGAAKAMGPVNSLSRKASEYLLGRQSSSFLPRGLLSGFLSKESSENTKGNTDNTIILMGSLPSTTL